MTNHDNNTLQHQRYKQMKILPSEQRSRVFEKQHSDRIAAKTFFAEATRAVQHSRIFDVLARHGVAASQHASESGVIRSAHERLTC